MKISFGGIKNAGYQIYKQEKPLCEDLGNGTIRIYPRMTRSEFHVELTNENGKDKDEFNDLLNKYPNKYNPNTINITQILIEDQQNDRIQHVYGINDNVVEFNEKNLRTYIKMFNLMKRVSEVDPKEAKMDERYIFSMESIDAFYFFSRFFTSVDSRGEEHLNPEFFRMAESCYNIDWAQKGAKRIKKRLSNILNDFFLN